MTRLFISHSRLNSGAALKLAQTLEKRGIETWLDVEKLSSGSDWNEQVALSIRSCDAVLFLIGPPGPTDRWQQFEWQQVAEEEYFLDPAYPLIPVVIDNAEIPGFLKTRRAIEVTQSVIDFDDLAQRVEKALSEPESTVDTEKLELGKQARERALKSFGEYSRRLEEEDFKRASLRSLI